MDKVNVESNAVVIHNHGGSEIIERLVDMRSAFAVIFIFLMVQVCNAQSEESDFLLEVLPPIIAATRDNSTPPVEPFTVTQIKLMSGRWSFSREDASFDNFYRFDPSTVAQVTGQDAAGIAGETHINADFDFITSSADAVYVASPAAWTIFEPWGPPNFDLGSLYVFTRISDTFSASHFFYEPSTLELSTGIATPATGRKLSSEFKLSNKTSTRAGSAAKKLLYQQEMLAAYGEQQASDKSASKSTQDQSVSKAIAQQALSHLAKKK